MVVVTLVKIPVEALLAPMVVPLIEPPEMVAFELVRLMMLAVVPEAVVKPSQVEVEPVKLPFVAKRVVAVAFVNTPVEALVAPMVVPLIVPPEMVAFELVRLMMLPVVPEAVPNPSQEEVAPTYVPLVAKTEVPLAVVKPSQVEVALVAVRL